MRADLAEAESMGVTAGAFRRSAIDRLRAAGIETAELDARILFCKALGVDTATLHASTDLLVPPAVQREIEHDLGQRIAGTPIARIVGYKEFWSKSFELNQDTLVPRPETETVVEAALTASTREAKLRVIDLGTGSGILLAAILAERPNAFGIGIDRSANAIARARDNLTSLGLAARSEFICGNWADAVDSSFDLVVANPPYICSGEIADLPRAVREHDPRLALDGGPDGLDAYGRIVSELPRLLGPKGIAVLELGSGQEDRVASIARGLPLAVVKPARRDLAGIARALILRSQG
jgi:release factor glutamine methyltransferase